MQEDLTVMVDHNLQVAIADNPHQVEMAEHHLQLVTMDHQTKEVNPRAAIQTLDQVMTLKIQAKIHLTAKAIKIKIEMM